MQVPHIFFMVCLTGKPDQSPYRKQREMKNQEILKIRRDLEDKGMSLTAIARDLGVTKQHVSHVLRDKSVSARVKKAIVMALGWDPGVKHGTRVKRAS